MIKAVFFDVGNTLIHPAIPTSEQCRRMLEQHGFVVSREQVSAAMRIADTHHMARYHKLNDDWAHPHTIQSLWLDYYRHVFDLLHFTDHDQQLAYDLIRWYGQPQAWQPYPDVATILPTIAERDLVVGAVSDWGRTLTSILHAHQIAPHLDFVIASGNIGLSKPNVQLYRLALDRANVQPHEALHIGDSYYADVCGARGAGIHPVLLDRSASLPPLDCRVVTDLLQLLSLLDDIS
jgi:putative hydrolase of the HAD superfamily